MSEPIRQGGNARVRRWRFVSGAVLVAAAAFAALSSAGAEARSAALPSNTSPPTVSGTAVVGETLTADPGSWTGTPPISYAYAWLRCDAGGASCAAIGSATSPSYEVASGDIGSTLRVRVTASNGEGPVVAESAQTAVVTGVVAPVNTAEPVISGSPVEGSTLAATTGTWTGTSLAYAYQWVRCAADGGLPDGSNCPTIGGATSSTYTLTGADVGQRLRVQVTASNTAGSAAVASNPTAIVTQSPTVGPPSNTIEPSISGTPVQGRFLFASIGTWTGEAPISYAYQWVRCGSNGGLPDGSNCAFIPDASSSSYVLVAADVGSRLRIRVTASNGLGVQTAASNPTDVVQATTTTSPLAPANRILPLIFGTAARGQVLTSTAGVWVGSSPLLYTYQWLRCGSDGGQPSGSDCPAIAGATATQYVATADDVGRRLRTQVTARNTAGFATATSGPTALVQATAPTTPTTPTPPTPGLPPGAIRLPDGKVSVPATSVSLPERLVAAEVVFTPNPVRSRKRPLELRVRVLDTRGYVVRDALVFARSTPLLTSAPGEQRSGRDGWARLRMMPAADFPLGGGQNVQFWIRVRKAGEPLLAGVSNRRLVQVATSAG